MRKTKKNRSEIPRALKNRWGGMHAQCRHSRFSRTDNQWDAAATKNEGKRCLGIGNKASSIRRQYIRAHSKKGGRYTTQNMGRITGSEWGREAGGPKKGVTKTTRWLTRRAWGVNKRAR